MQNVAFVQARPVWARGCTHEMNVTLVFTASLPAGEKRLRIAGCSAWQVFADGRFLAAGPARAGHGFYRVDEIMLSAGAAALEIRIAGYNVNSFYLLDEEPFLCAEVLAGETVLAATGAEGFTVCRFTERVQRVQRYSFQRPFAEAYRMADAAREPIGTEITADRRFIAREVPYPEYEQTAAEAVIARGTFTVAPEPANHYEDRAVTGISPRLKGFKKEEFELYISREAERVVCSFPERDASDASVIELPAHGCAIADLGRELSGFLAFDVETDGGRLYLTFDELLSGGDIRFTRLGGVCSAVIWELTPGVHRLITFEPYSMRYLKLACTGAARVTNLRMIRYEYPAAPIRKKPAFTDAQLSAVYDAAVATFRQNTVDIFMDCPSRERAGWLCDSFFTARVEYALTGKTPVEHAFLENFLMPPSFACLPEGMLPMCYPSDHYDGKFIPNWAMWYVLELEEYVFVRGGERSLAERAKERLYALLLYFRRFENADGLLERLESWVFVEWSHANDLVQDINYPTNMLYSRFKRAMAHLYGDEPLAAEADALAQVIRERSFTGTWFCDNAVYRDGSAVPSGECTESCQYYAFFTGVATRELYPALWETLVNDFGPQRRTDNRHPEIAFANAFIGNYLRLELLWNAGMRDRVAEETRGYFGYMAERTGTLWENVGDTASCNHGFASHAAIWLLE